MTPTSWHWKVREPEGHNDLIKVLEKETEDEWEVVQVTPQHVGGNTQPGGDGDGYTYYFVLLRRAAQP